jgi:hypothetical protein
MGIRNATGLAGVFQIQEKVRHTPKVAMVMEIARPYRHRVDRCLVSFSNRGVVSLLSVALPEATRVLPGLRSIRPPWLERGLVGAFSINISSQETPRGGRGMRSLREGVIKNFIGGNHRLSIDRETLVASVA